MTDVGTHGPSVPEAGRLPCGAAVDDLLDQVAEGRAARRGPDRDHQRRCPHCRAALAEYARTWAPVRTAAAEPVRAPEGVLEQALATLRRTRSPAATGVLTGDRGVTRIAARVVVGVAAAAARAVPGVRAALGEATALDEHGGVPGGEPGERGERGGPPSEDAAGTSGRAVRLAITVAAEYGHPLDGLTDRVRRAVREQVEALTGLDPVAVDVVVDDVLPPGPGRPRRPGRGPSPP